MKNLGSFILAILLFTGIASAQNKNVLAEGNPALTQTMVNRFVGLMEWSLDLAFNETDQSEVRNQLVAYWKNGDEKNIKAVLNILDFEQKLSASGDDQKRNLQPQVQQKLLETMESESQDPLNKILLAIYNKKHNKSADSAGAAQANGSLSELVGRWQVSHMNSMTTRNTYSGAIGDANGMIAEYNIKADGSVIFSFYLSQNNYGCATKIKTSKTGRAAIKGSKVTFAYDSGTTTSSDSCNAKNNYTKNLGKTSETFDYNLKRVDGKTQFCFASPSLKDCATKIN